MGKGTEEKHIKEVEKRKGAQHGQLTVGAANWGSYRFDTETKMSKTNAIRKRIHRLATRKGYWRVVIHALGGLNDSSGAS